MQVSVNFIQAAYSPALTYIPIVNKFVKYPLLLCTVPDSGKRRAADISKAIFLYADKIAARIYVPCSRQERNKRQPLTMLIWFWFIFLQKALLRKITLNFPREYCDRILSRHRISFLVKLDDITLWLLGWRE